MTLSNTTFQQLKNSQILDLSTFVVTENFNHHANDVSSEIYQNDIQEIFEEESKFFDNSEIFVAQDENGNIEGSIRSLKWNYKDMLPIQKIFGIDPMNVATPKQSKNIYHIGRFAIKKELME